MAIYNAPESLHVGNGVETVFGFTFPYLRPQDIAVTVNGAPTDWVLVGTAQVSINPAPEAGATIRIYRDTPAQFPAFLFSTGVPMLPRYIDENNRQLLYALQEGLLQYAQTQALAAEALALAKQARADAAAAAASAAQQAANIRRTLRVSGSAPEIAVLPSVSARAGKILGFDSAGNPVGTIPAAGSGAELALILADTSDPQLGATIAGRAVVAVGSVEALRLQPQRPDLLFYVSSYYPNGATGGGVWRWDTTSTLPDDYGSILAVPGVVAGRFIRVNRGSVVSLYDYGVRASNTGLDNRLRMTALYRSLHGSANTVVWIDEDFPVDSSTPIIVPADTHTVGARGTLVPVLELPLQPASVAAQPDGTFLCYGGIFAGGDPITKRRYSETLFPYRGRNTWTGVKIRNRNNLGAALGYSLHGMITHGGISVYVDCEVYDMPNTGIVTTMYREAHYIRTKCNGNGMLGGGGARNGISNTSTYSVQSGVFPEEDRTTRLSVLGGQYMRNYEEGIQFANCPLVWIEGPDCRFNLDRAIEGDTAYPQASKTRPNDQIHIYGADCRGVPGTSNYSISLGDGFNKDVFIGDDCKFGGCTQTAVSASCSAGGSFTFSGRNTFELELLNARNGCHAMYINAGRIDLSSGFTIRGAHSRTALNASMLVTNNDLGGGSLVIGQYDSDVEFLHAVSGRVNTTCRVLSGVCPTGRSHVLLTLTADTPLIELSNLSGGLNSSAGTDQGLLRLLGLATFTLDELRLSGIRPTAAGAVRYPVAHSADARAGSILRILSHGNYWWDFTFPTGNRLTALAGVAAKTSVLDMPVLA